MGHLIFHNLHGREFSNPQDTKHIASLLSSGSHNTNVQQGKRVIFVIGADGLIGRMAVTALSSMHGKTTDIRAGVRNPGRAKRLSSLTGVTVVQAELGGNEKLRKLFKDVDAVYIISSDYSIPDRAKLFIDTATAAKEAGVKHILVYSQVAAQQPDTIFGKQYIKIETAIARLGTPYTVLRFPILVDNLMAHMKTIKNMSTIFWPARPDESFTPVVSGDASIAAAAILASPQKHAGKTYTIVSDRVNYYTITEEFTKALGRHVAYVRIPYNDAKAFLQKHRFSEIRAEAILELYRLIDAGSCVTNQGNLDDFYEITGQKPTSVRTWIKQRAYLFS